MFNLILSFIFNLVILITDIFIFCSISDTYKTKKDKQIIVIIGFLIFILALFSPTQHFMNFGVTLIEMGLLYLYFVYVRKNDPKIILGSCLTLGLVDIILLTLEVTLKILLPNFVQTNIKYFLNVIISLIVIGLVDNYKRQIRNAFLSKSSPILLGVLIYIYITGFAINYLSFNSKMPKEIVIIFLGLLIFQTIFAIVMYMGIIHIQKEIQTKQQQKQIKNENNQLKEYTDYLEKNEDELRRFKHDYQNILNSLRISAEKGDTESVVKQLSDYTNTQFDEKALRKYKGVNHVHVEELKSIAIAKLAKLYNHNIDYSFGCEVDIYQIPKSVNILDLVRIIGITFDNAIEESKIRIQENGDKNSAKVDAMYYQEDGNFEFRIRNRIGMVTNTNFNRFSQEGYTTKKLHSGIGLANVKQIEAKYEDSMLINYGIEDGWFDFDLTIMPDDLEEFS